MANDQVPGVASTKGHRKRIALLVNDVFSSYQARFLAAIERAARRKECNLLVFMGRELAHPDLNERAQNAVYDWVSPAIADGALVLSGTIANFTDLVGMVGLCERLGAMPVVSIGLSIPGFAAVVLNNRLAQAVAVNHLVQQHQRRRIAYIGGPLNNEEASDRLSGYRDTLKNYDLPTDDRLIARGHFNLPTGQEAMREILARGVDFDAVAAANDSMALGAMDVLRDAGIRVPEDVLVVGFDDTPIARFATRSLTTVAQPIDQMAEASISGLLHLIGADATSVLASFDAELVLRESCGCGYASARSAQSPRPPSVSAAEYVRVNRGTLEQEVEQAHESTTSTRWKTPLVPRLLDGLVAELSGGAGAFSQLLERTTEEALAHHASLEELGHIVVRMQGRLDAAGYHGASQFDLEQIWMKARSIISSAISRKEARAALDQIERSVHLRYVTQRLSIAFESRSIAAELERSLPTLGVDAAYVALTPMGEPGIWRPLLAMTRGTRANVLLQPIGIRQLFPDGFVSAMDRSLLVWAVTFESEVLGVLALGGTSEPLIGEAVRAQIGAALKMGELHARVVEQTSIHERLARDQFTHEMAMAKRIQTALAPTDLDAPGLEMAAGTTPADLVGGDYYDVLPVPGGCWLGIGDVAGHGLMSGLVMLMIQSIVSTLVTVRPDASPAELVIEVNRVLVPNLRRLQRHDHATFALVRVFEDGCVRFAGAHEDFIVWRMSTRRCELVTTDGTWLGLIADIRPVTADRELALVPGDLLVLLTDGILEARNARNEHLGIDQVCRIIEANADLAPQVIQAELVAAVRAWAPVQQDDVTCIVVRFTGARR
jgi:phosphoserine phosphatase RsbU/P